MTGGGAPAAAALRIATKALVVLISIAGTAVGVVAAGRSGVLEAAAVPFALVLIALYRLLGPRAEHAAWAVFLFCVGLTYVDPARGTLALELAGLGVCAALAAGGVLVSPWLLAAGFAAHIAWDFVPRDLPRHLVGLPVACLLFDGVVAAYVGVQAHTRRWAPLRALRGGAA